MPTADSYPTVAELAGLSDDGLRFLPAPPILPTALSKSRSCRIRHRQKRRSDVCCFANESLDSINALATGQAQQQHSSSRRMTRTPQHVRTAWSNKQKFCLQRATVLWKARLEFLRGVHPTAQLLKTSESELYAGRPRSKITQVHLIAARRAKR